MSIVHLKSENELIELISNENVLVVIDCYADWCGPCKMLDEKLKKLYVEWKKLYGDNIEVCKLNIDEESFSEFVELNKIQSLPTILFVRGDNVVEKVVGSNDKKIKEIVENLFSKKMQK